MRVIGLGLAAILVGLAAPAAAQEIEDFKIHQGICSADSQVAGNRFVCDMLVTATTEPGQMMLIFTDRPNDAEQAIVAIGGPVAKDGSVTIEHVQLKPGVRTPFDGRCEIKRKGKAIVAVRCAATERGGTRTVLVDTPSVKEFRP